MSVSSKNIHFVVVNCHCLTITSARFFANDEAMSIIINYLLFQLFVICLLVSDCLQSFNHWFSGRW